MDSQEQLIDELSQLDCWAAPGCEDRLIIVDANEIEFPVALSLFDLGLSGSASPLEKRRTLNTALEVTMFMLDSLLGSDLTGKQAVVFRFIMQAIFEIRTQRSTPSKTFFRMAGMRSSSRTLRSWTAQPEFFETEFRSKAFVQTRQEITRRLYGILAIKQWERMFNHPKNKLDLFAEMNKGRIILINTAKSLLQPKGCEAFGRFFIAMIAIAAQRRATLQSKLPVHVFIDEAQDYIGGTTADSNFLNILEQCRKQKIALTIAHQYLAQMGIRTLDTLNGVGVKYVSSLTDRDAHTMARGMKCKPEMLENMPRGTFAVYARNLTLEAQLARVDFTACACRQDVPAAFRKLLDAMNDKYGARPDPKPDEPIVNFTPRPPEMEPWPLSRTRMILQSRRISDTLIDECTFPC